MGNIFTVLLSWSDYFLVGCRLTGLRLQMVETIRCAPPCWKIIDLEKLLNALWDFPDNMAGNSVEALASLRNREIRLAVNTFVSSHSLPASTAHKFLCSSKDVNAKETIRTMLEKSKGRNRWKTYWISF